MNKKLIIILSITGILLLIPLIAMQFTNEVNWKLADFIIAGILLFGFGVLINYASIKIKNKTLRIIAVIAIIFLLLLIWAELAVGIFGTPFAGS